MGRPLNPEEASQLPSSEIYGVQLSYPARGVAIGLYRADNIVDLLYTLAADPDINNVTDISITTKPEEW